MKKFQKIIIEYYAKIANIYEHAMYVDRPVSMIEEQEFLSKMLESSILGKKVVDVGCGTGYWLAYLPKDFEKVGVDISKQMLEKAKEKGLKNVVLGDVQNIPLKSNYFDTSLCFFTLQHILSLENLISALKEIYRITRKKGRIIIAENIFNTKGEIKNECMLEIEEWVTQYGLEPVRIYRRLTNTKELEEVIKNLPLTIINFNSKNNVFCYVLEKNE